jgi:hypothetical protein
MWWREWKNLELWGKLNKPLDQRIRALSAVGLLCTTVYDVTHIIQRACAVRGSAVRGSEQRRALLLLYRLTLFVQSLCLVPLQNHRVIHFKKYVEETRRRSRHFRHWILAPRYAIRLRRSSPGHRLVRSANTRCNSSTPSPVALRRRRIG